MDRDTSVMRVKAISCEADSILKFDLRPVGDKTLPPFTAGAHIDLHLSNGLVRSYSLLNSQDEPHRFVIAVLRDPKGRGGSQFLHEQVKAGDLLRVSSPRNHFALLEDAEHTVLVGGGIGITPLLSMAKRLDALKRSWHMHYCIRDRTSFAFDEDIAAHGNRVSVRCDSEHSGFLDMRHLIAQAKPGTHFYCCGPTSMIGTFEAAAKDSGRDTACFHREHFRPPGDVEVKGGFMVILARSQARLHVDPGRSILDVLRESGRESVSSCEQGICGECQVKVLAGIPDHTDFVLSDAERASNKVMMICCSGSKTKELVLDL